MDQSPPSPRGRDRSDHGVRSAAWSVLALGLSLAGCTSPNNLNDECVFNADCVDPLICAGRRCRAQCASNRDCPTGEVCSGAGQVGKKVCVRPQSTQLCALNSDCSARSSCADGVCHAVCAGDGDCARPPATNTCNTARRICAEPDRVTEAGSPEDGGTPSDAGSDSGSPSDAGSDSGTPSDGGTPSDVPGIDATSPADATRDDVSAADGPIADGSVAPDAMDAAVGDAAPTDGAAPDAGDAAAFVDLGMLCDGTPDLANDPDNCGRCGNRCPRPSAGTGSVTCSGGACRTTCAGGFTSCNGLCTDGRVDRNHCGGCGIVCEVDCVAGVCVNPVEVHVNWGGGTIVRLSDNSWRGFGQGEWAREVGATPEVFPWVGSRDIPSPLAIPLDGQNLTMTYTSRIFRVTSGGTLQGLGANGQGSLGDGTNVARTRWTDVPGLTAVRDVSSCLSQIATTTCAAYGADGRVNCWGNDLGHSYANPGGSTRMRPDTAYPALRFDDQPLLGVIDVARGTQFTLALRDNGEVWTWGVNGAGRLGLGLSAATDYAAQARRIPSLPPCTAVYAGLDFACALDSSGGVWCWGENSDGQVGDGTTVDRNVPTRVLTPDPAMPTQSVPLAGIVGLAMAPQGVCAITSARGLYCWGENGLGQLGVALAGNVLRAAPVPAPAGVATLRVRSVSLGSNSGCALTLPETGSPAAPPRVYCWGYEGTLGFPSSGRTRAPTRAVYW